MIKIKQVEQNKHTYLCQDSQSVQFFPQVDSWDLADLVSHNDRPASTWSIRKLGALQTRLDNLKRHLPSFVDKRVQRIRAHKTIEIANEIFGFNGWSTEILDVSGSIDEDESGFSAKVTVAVRITLQDDTSHESSGVGSSYNSPTKGEAFNKAKKEALTEALKNCIDGFAVILLDFEAKGKSGYYR